MEGKLIVIDGVDASGKSTQIKLLKEKFPDAIFTREPGGTPEAEQIREQIFNTEPDARTPERDFELFWKARKLHIQDLLVPSLKKGKLIFSDRLDSTTYSYQIHGDQNYSLIDKFFELRNEYVEPLKPIYIILDLLPEESRDRMMKDKVKVLNRLDKKPLEFYVRGRDGFSEFGEKVSNVYFIDAVGTPEDVQSRILSVIERFS